MNSRELFEGILCEKREAYQYIYNHFAPSIVKWVMTHGGTREDGEDVVQTTIIAIRIKIYEKRTYMEKGQFSSFLMGTAIRTWLNMVRDRRRQEGEKVSARIMEYYEVIQASEILRRISQEEDYELLEKGLQKLSEEEKNLLFAHYINRKKLTELAQEYNKTAQATRQWLHRIRKKIRKTITKLRVGD